MFLVTFVIMICLANSAQAKNNLREAKAFVGKDAKKLEGSPYQQTFIPGYSSGFVNANWYYSSVASATCPATTYSQAGVLVGVCQPTGVQTKTVTSTTAGTVGTKTTYTYQSSLTQIYTGVGVATPSDCASIVTIYNPFTGGTTTTPIAAGIVTLYFEDPACDPQYWIQGMNSFSSVAGLNSAFTGIKTAGPTGCVPLSGATAPATEWVSLTCTPLPNSVTNPLALTWSNALAIVPNNVPAPYYSNFVSNDITQTTNCNKTLITEYSYIAAVAITTSATTGVTTAVAPVGVYTFGGIGDIPSPYVIAFNNSDGSQCYNQASAVSTSTTYPLTCSNKVQMGYCNVGLTSGKASSATTNLSTFTSKGGATLIAATNPEKIYNSAVVNVYWYTNPSNVFTVNDCPAGTSSYGTIPGVVTFTSSTSTVTYTPQFQYSFVMGYCYTNNVAAATGTSVTGSYRYQVGSYISGTGTAANAYELVRISYTDTACRLNPTYTDLDFSTILPFQTTNTNIFTPGATCFPASSTTITGTTPSFTSATNNNYGGFYTVAITTSASTPAPPTTLSFGSYPLTTAILSSTVGIESQLYFQDPTPTYASSSCTTPLYALYYQVNTCLNINTAGMYELDVTLASPAKNGLLTPYDAVYIQSVMGLDGYTVNTYFYYNTYGTCMLDTVNRCTNSASCVKKYPVPNANTDTCQAPTSIDINYNLGASVSYQLTFTPGGVNPKNFGSGYIVTNWYQSCSDVFSTSCCSASPKYQTGMYYGYCLPIYGTDTVTKIGSYISTLDISGSGTTVKGYMKTAYTDSACSVNPVTSYYPFNTPMNIATSTCTKQGTVPYDGYYTMNVFPSSPNTIYGGTISPPAPVSVSAPFFSVIEFSQYSNCGQTTGFNYYSLNTCLNIGATTAYYFAAVSRQDNGVPTYTLYTYTGTNAVELCIKDIMINGNPTTGTSTTTLSASTFDTCVNTNPVTSASTTSQWKLTYATVAQSVSAGKKPFGSNGWFSVYQYFDEGCQSPPLAQYDMYFGYCYKKTSPTTGQVLYSYKYQIGDTNCASGNFLQVTYSDALCTQNPIVTDVPLSTYLPTNSLKCTRNNVGGDKASGYFSASCNASTVMPTSFPNVAVLSSTSNIISFRTYQQNQSSPLLSNYLLGSTPQCITPLMSFTYATNKCLFNFDTTGTVSYYDQLGSRVMRYDYPSFIACQQDPINPKCTTSNSASTNAFCTGMTDVTPTGYCFTENQGNNKLYTYVK